MKFTALLIAFLISLLCTSCSRETTEASQLEEPPQENDDTEILASLSWPQLEAILEELGPDGYITRHAHYTPQEVDDNVHLLYDWVSLFENGKAAQPLYVLSITVDTYSILRFDYDGSEYYTVTSTSTPVGEYSGVFSNSSSVVSKRTFDYVFCDNVNGQPYKLPHTSMIIEEVDYDLETMPSLGSIGPGEACEIFRVHYPDSSDPPIVFGAVKINGEFYYIVGSYYIKADGTLIMLAFHGLRVEFDANAREIRPPAQG